jgi:hypothetical protein
LSESNVFAVLGNYRQAFPVIANHGTTNFQMPQWGQPCQTVRMKFKNFQRLVNRQIVVLVAGRKKKAA